VQGFMLQISQAIVINKQTSRSFYYNASAPRGCQTPAFSVGKPLCCGQLMETR